MRILAPAGPSDVGVAVNTRVCLRNSPNPECVHLEILALRVSLLPLRIEGASSKPERPAGAPA